MVVDIGLVAIIVVTVLCTIPLGLLMLPASPNICSTSQAMSATIDHLLGGHANLRGMFPFKSLILLT